jgi:hypothetical protein
MKPFCDRFADRTIKMRSFLHDQGQQVKKTCAEAVENVPSDLEVFQINHQIYFDDAEPQGWFDAALTGRVKTLLAFCRTLGWPELVFALEDLLPIQCNAPSRLRKYRPTLLSHELDQNFRQGISHSLEYGPVNFGFRTCL